MHARHLLLVAALLAGIGAAVDRHNHDSSWWLLAVSAISLGAAWLAFTGAARTKPTPTD